MNDGEELLLVDCIIFFSRGHLTDSKATGFPSWLSTAPTAKSDASVVTSKGLVGSAGMRIGALLILSCKNFIAWSQSLVQIYSWSLRSSRFSAVICFAYPSMNRR